MNLKIFRKPHQDDIRKKIKRAVNFGPYVVKGQLSSVSFSLFSCARAGTDFDVTTCRLQNQRYFH